MQRPLSFFQGSEFPRLLALTVVMVAGWGFVWRYGHKAAEPVEPPVAVMEKPQALKPDTSIEFESVTDRTTLGLRDNAAYALLLERARTHNAADLATAARRDVVLSLLWDRPSNYRGVPIHLLGTALRIIRYPSKLSKDGWLYEAWIISPDTPLVPFVCVFEEPPKGLPLGADISERVVFNGYFLKIMKYQSANANRGAPVLIGRIGWEPREPAPVEPIDPGTTLRWSLVILAGMFVISLFRWLLQLKRLFGGPTPSRAVPRSSPSEELDPEAFQKWLHDQAASDEMPAKTHEEMDRDSNS